MTGLITDPGFDKSRSEEYKLSIQVSLDGFSFSVTHAHQKHLLALEEFPFELSSSRFLGRHFKEWVLKSDILRKKYSSTTVLYYPENITFIPSGYHDSLQTDSIGKLVFGNQNDTIFIDNHLPNASGNLIFPVPANLLESIKSLFPVQKLLHPSAVLDNETVKAANLNEDTAVIYFGRKSFTLFIYSGSKLKVVNNYVYASPGDVVYYSVAAARKLKLQPENTALFLAGEVTPRGEVHENLKKFFKRTIFFIPEVHYDAEIFKEPLHRFIVLF